MTIITVKEDEYLYNEMVKSEKSGIGDFNKVIEFLNEKTYKLFP